MTNPDSPDTRDSAPWEAKRVPSGKNFLRRILTWAVAVVLVLLIVWGLWPKAVSVETGLIARSPLTVHVSEEGKTRVRNRYVVSAPVAGKMRRVSLKAGDPVGAGKTLLTVIEPMVPPLLDPRARKQAEELVSLHAASRRQAEEVLNAKRAALKLAEDNRARTRNVRGEGSLSQADRDAVEAEASVKAAEVRGGVCAAGGGLRTGTGADGAGTSRGRFF